MASILGKRACAGAVGLVVFLFTIYGAVSAQRDRDDLETVRGTVKRFTTAPKGEIDGAELDNGTVIHWPPHLEKRFTDIIAKGDRIEVSGRTETRPRGETALEVRSVTNLRTKLTRVNDDTPPPGKKGKKGKKGKGKEKERNFGPVQTVRGTVQRFTKAPRGEIDGLVLDDDTILHWPPHLESRFADVAKKGERVEATGRQETNPEGVEQIEVETFRKLGAGQAGKGAQPNTDSTERRLRNLEDKVDRLLEELKQLRRQKK